MNTTSLNLLDHEVKGLRFVCCYCDFNRYVGDVYLSPIQFRKKIFKPLHAVKVHMGRMHKSPIGLQPLMTGDFFLSGKRVPQ